MGSIRKSGFVDSSRIHGTEILCVGIVPFSFSVEISYTVHESMPV